MAWAAGLHLFDPTVKSLNLTAHFKGFILMADFPRIRILLGLNKAEGSKTL